MLSQIGILVFLFDGFSNFFGTVSFIGNPKAKNLQKIFKRSFFVLSWIFISWGVISYLCIGKFNMKHNYLTIQIFTENDSNIFTIICIALFYLQLLLILIFQIVRIKIDIIIERNYQQRLGPNIILTTLIYWIIVLFQFFDFDIKRGIGLLGITITFSVSLFFPFLMFLNLKFNRSSFIQLITLILMVLNILFIIGTFLYQIYQQVIN